MEFIYVKFSEKLFNKSASFFDPDTGQDIRPGKNNEPVRVAKTVLVRAKLKSDELIFVANSKEDLDASAQAEREKRADKEKENADALKLARIEQENEELKKENAELKKAAEQFSAKAGKK